MPAEVLIVGAGCLIAAFVRAFHKQKRELSEACKLLRSAQEQLDAKARALDQAEQKDKLERESRINDLSQQVVNAQRELESAREICRQAAMKLEQSMSDLSVTDTELRAARSQLTAHSRDLTLMREQLEAAEGELGLTRSQNELMKRELDALRRQLREAGQQLEGYIMEHRGRKDGTEGGRMGRAEYEDDLTAVSDSWGY